MTDQEMWEELLKLCGWKQKKYRAPACTHTPRCTHWVDSKGKHSFLPKDITLGNLCKWIVPALKPKTVLMETYYDESDTLRYSFVVLSEKQSGGIWTGDNADPALALLQACYKAFRDIEL